MSGVDGGGWEGGGYISYESVLITDFKMLAGTVWWWWCVRVCMRFFYLCVCSCVRECEPVRKACNCTCLILRISAGELNWPPSINGVLSFPLCVYVYMCVCVCVCV